MNECCKCADMAIRLEARDQVSRYPAWSPSPSYSETVERFSAAKQALAERGIEP